MKHLYALTTILLLLAPNKFFGQVSYSSSIQPILNAKCVGCHGPGQGIDVRNYSSVMSSVASRYSANLVIPDDANASPLYDKVRLDQAPKFGSRMPQGSSLSQDEVNLIRDWINEGALENAATSNETITQILEYRLLPNYPNPFNPSTNIQFISERSNRYEISVHNTLGQQIHFRSGASNQGLNTIRVDLVNQSSGLYFYSVRIFESNSLVFSSSDQFTLIK